MSENVNFIIEDTKLYLDYMLEQHDCVPLFYVCKDALGSRYVVLCSDMDNESYLIVRVSLFDLCDMLYGKLDIRSLFLNQSDYWSVTCLGEDATSDLVEKHSIKDFPDGYLPNNGEFYVLYDDAHKYYASQIYCELSKRINDIKVHRISDPMMDERDVCNHIKPEFYDMIELKVTIINDLSKSCFSNEDIGLFAA